MSVLNFCFDLKQAGLEASVRVWIDDPRARDLHSETELPLQRSGDRWTGRHEIADLDGDACFWLRVGVCGTAGAAWSFEVREEGEADPLYLDGDELVMRKEWLVALCHRGRQSPLSAVA